MTALFVVALIAGLGAGVRIMLVGVEQPRAFGDTAAPRMRSFPAGVAVFGIVFGATGYSLMRLGLGNIGGVVGALAIAAVAAAGAVRLVHRWWRVPAEHDVDDPRYVLQGHLAQVVSPIEADQEGSVAYELGGSRHVSRARSLDATALGVGAEVVIERVEGDVAFVESWTVVEKRL
jgi:hypothetical protein